MAVRRLCRAPAYTVFSTVSLALGISITAAIYATVRTLFWAPLGIAEPARVFPVLHNGTLLIPGMSLPDFQDLLGQQSSFDALAASYAMMAAVVAEGVAATEQVEA
ncbi:MAG: hypothetical protein ACREJ4_02915, partial [Candidatus Methylomirabilaceae bacterium]